jgi:PAS domain S-box-containing protein
MSLITFLAPDISMLNRAREAFKAHHSDIDIEVGLLSKGVQLAASHVAAGTEIIITRGGTALAIKNARIQVALVEIPITGFDIIRTVEQAKLQGSRIGAVAFPSMMVGINCLTSVLGVEIRLYPINSEYETETQVLQALDDGVEVLIGGFITEKAAKKHSFPFALIDSGVEGMLQAAEEAKRIAYARSLEKLKTSQFRAVLDYSYDGIISVDSQYRITVFNPIAEQLTGINSTKALNKKIDQVWPELNLYSVIHSGKEDLGQILKINEVDVLCNKIAINVNGHAVGAVVTFQDVAKIQQMERRVRHRIYASGNVANSSFEDIVGSSAPLKRTIEIAKEFSLTQSSILILGETGTGKEVFAQSIHNYSGRKKGPFVAINCAALPSQILESELFGYVSGAFTGANQKGKPGLFEVAHGGTIFLDEIAEMEYLTQGKLLRVLQEKNVRRLGSDSIIPIDVRVIAATNRKLKTLVKENKFRADLYYRLNVLNLKLPPLRERIEDIEILAKLFLQEQAGIMKRHLKIAPSAIQALTHYTWPGNIRELKSIIERVIAVYRHEIIDAAIINQMLEGEADDYDNMTPADKPLSESEEINQALAMTKGKYAAAAKILGISRSTLWRKLKRLGLK